LYGVESSTLQSLFGRKPAKSAERRVRPQWHAPESQPLRLGEKSPLEMAAKPRAMVAGLGLLAFLGVGALAAIIVDQTASSQAEAGPQRIAQPAPKPVEAAVAARPEETAKPAVQTEEQGNQPPKQAVAKLPEQQPKPQVAAVLTPEPKQEVAALPHDDPRWGRTVAAVPSGLAPPQAQTAPAKDSDLAAFAEPVPTVRPQPAPTPAATSPGDPLVTAAISAQRPTPIPTDPIIIPADGGAEAETTRQARIRTAVNMRTRGADGASVITVVPTNATVGVVGCQSWCEIVYKNRRGWVYKGFVK
jgi:Bacterial SH3 domain